MAGELRRFPGGDQRVHRAGDHVVCVTRWTGTGKASDAAVDVSQVDLYELRDGKIVRATLAYPDRTAALEAVGLCE
jgi:ketosteroid isomerase-like protein